MFLKVITPIFCIHFQWFYKEGIFYKLQKQVIYFRIFLFKGSILKLFNYFLQCHSEKL